MRLALRALICGMALVGSAAMAEPRHEATITRTTYGIPHIVASDWGGIGYGVAYAYAEDNLCLMAEQFATLAGERSLHFGPDNKPGPGNSNWTNLESDLAHRALIDLPRLRKKWRERSPEAQALTAGYVAGYNRFLRDAGPAGIPAPCRGKPWVRPISLDDMLRSYEALVSSAILGYGAEIVNAAPPTEGAPVPTQGAALELPQSALASNGWGFGGAVTANGRGLLIGNPHYPWVGSRRFWQMHTTIPGEYDAMGAGLAGSPLPVIGFNKDVAWTHTVNGARHFTLHALTLDPADPTRYVVDGETIAMETREVSVPMPDGAAPVTRTIHFSRFGPVLTVPGTPIAWSASTAYALGDANLENQRAVDAWIGIGKASSVGEIAAAVGETLGIPWANTVAADRHGDALHADVTAVPNVTQAKIAACATPLSALIASRVILLDGSRSECVWDAAPDAPVPGLLPASEQAVTIRRDYLTNSNNSYWLSHLDEPHRRLSPIMGEFETELPPRMRSNLTETEAMLAAGKVDHVRAKAMLFANKSYTADLVLDRVLMLCRTREALARGCDALAGWDRRYDNDSRGGYLFAKFWNRVWRLRDALWQVPFDPSDPANTPRDLVENGPTAGKLLDALGETIAELDADGVALDAEWGTVQAFRFGDEAIPVHGGDELAGVLNMHWLVTAVKEPGGIKPIHGSSYIQIVGFDEIGPVADAILAYSQSTDPASPHFADQTRLYSQKRWHRLPFTPREIAAQAIDTPKRIAE